MRISTIEELRKRDGENVLVLGRLLNVDTSFEDRVFLRDMIGRGKHCCTTDDDVVRLNIYAFLKEGEVKKTGPNTWEFLSFMGATTQYENPVFSVNGTLVSVETALTLAKAISEEAEKNGR